MDKSRFRHARNFNPLVAMAARVTIVEAEEIVPVSIDPDQVHVPGIYVKSFQGRDYKNESARRAQHRLGAGNPMIKGLNREQIAMRIARELKDGYY